MLAPTAASTVCSVLSGFTKVTRIVFVAKFLAPSARVTAARVKARAKAII
jgi:hypothetical protein